MLRQLGYDDCELLPGPLGGPNWPAGVLGSITHEAGVCLAVAARQSEELLGVGIDLLAISRAEVLGGLADLFLSPAESERHQHYPFSMETLAELFCAKEATVKAVSHLVGRYLDLAAISIFHHDECFMALVADVECSVRGHLTRIEDQIFAVACCWPPSREYALRRMPRASV